MQCYHVRVFRFLNNISVIYYKYTYLILLAKKISLKVSNV